MGLFGLCEGDDIVDTLRGVFNANIVRVPERQVQPTKVLASRDGKTAFRGDLGAHLAGPVPEELGELNVATSRMANLSGKRSRKVNAEVGLQILDGFLSGFGIPSAGVSAKFGNAKEVSFSFGDVARRTIDVGVLGRALEGKSLDEDNPATAIFFGDKPWHPIIIDSVIGSSDFSISVDRAKSGEIKLDVPAIQQLIADANVGVQVEAAASTQITFKGKDRLTFAFTAVRVFIDADGRITALPPKSGLSLADEASAGTQLSALPPRMVIDQPAMIEWDEAA